MLTQPPPRIARPEKPGTYELSPMSATTRARPISDAQAVAMIRPVQKRPSSAALPAFAILTLGVMLFALSYQRGIRIGEIAAIAMTPLAIFGLLRGAIRKVFIIAAVIGGVYLGAFLPQVLEPLVRKLSPGNEGWLAFALSAAIVLCGIFVVVVFARRLRRRLEPMPFFYSLDRWMGAFIGAAEGALVALTLCWVATMVRPHVERVRRELHEPQSSFRQQLCADLLRISNESSSGPFGDFVHRTNPIENLPALKDAVHQLNTTGTINLPGLDPATMEKLKTILNTDPNNPPPDLNKTIDELKKALESQQSQSSAPSN